MVDLCKYKNLLGEPGKGVHSIRFMNIAVVDVMLTILLAFLISYYTNYSLIFILILVFILGIILHRLFCVKTTIDKLIFSND